jgi:hypothetical protein
VDEYDDNVAGLATVGEDEDVVGALLKRALTKGKGGLGARVAMGLPRWAQHLTGQGISRPTEEMDTLPFTSTVLTLANQTGSATALPQRPFRGERIIAVATLLDTTTPGVFTDASDFVTISPAIFVGAVQVGASQGDVPLSAFKANAFGVRLAFPAAGQGTRIFIPYTSQVPLAATQSIVVQITVIGRAVR